MIFLKKNNSCDRSVRVLYSLYSREISGIVATLQAERLQYKEESRHEKCNAI